MQDVSTEICRDRLGTVVRWLMITVKWQRADYVAVSDAESVSPMHCSCYMWFYLPRVNVTGGSETSVKC